MEGPLSVMRKSRLGWPRAHGAHPLDHVAPRIALSSPADASRNTSKRESEGLRTPLGRGQIGTTFLVWNLAWVAFGRGADSEPNEAQAVTSDWSYRLE